MLEVVDLFRESDTIDELGVGSIRDAFSNGMFPGTSVLHTRLRYVLFIAWSMQSAASHRGPGEMAAALERLEYRTIDSLLTGGETQGVIGARARQKLQRLPSSAYWSALGAWGLRGDGSADQFFRREHAWHALTQRTAVADDPDARDTLPETGLDPHLPSAPERWTHQVDFSLTSAEEEYLSDRIATHTRGSLLSWLVQHPPTQLPDVVWDLDHLRDAPVELRRLVEQARRFQLVIHGANVLYNLLLARRSRHEELVETYEAEVRRWHDELAASEVLTDWDRTQWWSVIREHNPRIAGPTVAFLDRWVELLQTPSNDVSHNQRAAQLISNRERAIKGGRSRLHNQSALDQWNGGRGLGRHSFRWPVARSHLQDLYDARGTG